MISCELFIFINFGWKALSLALFMLLLKLQLVVIQGELGHFDQILSVEVHVLKLWLRAKHGCIVIELSGSLVFILLHFVH
jgi:hypothetical protein